MSITVADIRMAYPTPGHGYSVAGSFCMFCGFRMIPDDVVFIEFPDTRNLIRILLIVNPGLGVSDSKGTESWARRYANDIINLNVRRKFDEAWEVLDTALKHQNVERRRA